MTVATLPRVTAVLEALGLGPDLSMVPPAVLELARQRGTAVHRAIEAITYGYLDGVDPAIAGYLDAYRRFVAESGYQPQYAEVEVRHDVWRYVGHPDSIGFLGVHRVLLDFKTGDATGVEYQLAAYVMAWNHERPHERITAAGVVELRADGSYRYREVELDAALQVWQAAVIVYHAREGRGA